MDSASRESHSNVPNVGNRVHSVRDVLPENIRAISTFITKREGRLARFLKHDFERKMLKLQASFDAQKKQLEATVCQLQLEIDAAQQQSISFFETHHQTKPQENFRKFGGHRENGLESKSTLLFCAKTQNRMH